jgi:hypothetical protein
MNDEKTQVSASRMRIGVLFLFVWWAPIWALSPAIATSLDLKTSTVTLVIVILQTIIGVLGIAVAGKEVSNIIKKTPKKQVPGKIWHVLIHGSF